MDGNVMDAAEVDRLASLESREVLLAKAAGAMKASLSKAAYLFAAPPPRRSALSTPCARSRRPRPEGRLRHPLQPCARRTR